MKDAKTPNEPDLAPHSSSDRRACQMCMRRHREAGAYCSTACEARAAIPAGVALDGKRRSYYDKNSPIGRKSGKGVARPGGNLA